MQIGGQQQNLGQAGLDLAYSDFQQQQAYPYQQIGFMADLLQGAPMGTITTMTQPTPSPFQSAVGLGLTGLGIYGQGGGFSPVASQWATYSTVENDMINPAQYTKVLQGASDEQLMAMLKRPDKIPSQFIVVEINRRQAMRQPRKQNSEKAQYATTACNATGTTTDATSRQMQQPSGYYGGHTLRWLMRPYIQGGVDAPLAWTQVAWISLTLLKDFLIFREIILGLKGLPSARMMLASTNNSSASNQNALSPAEQIAMDDTAMTNIDSFDHHSNKLLTTHMVLSMMTPPPHRLALSQAMTTK